MEKFVLASSSDFELEAVRRALVQVGVRNATVWGIEPPHGHPEGNRSKIAHRASSVYQIRDVWPLAVKIGIGGGFSNSEAAGAHCFLEEAILVLVPPTREILTMCPAIAIDIQEVIELEILGHELRRVGTFFAERFAADPSDPHRYLTKGRVSRMDTLIAGLVTAFKQM